MKIFLDSADLNEITALRDTGFVDGVTTNPSLIAKSGHTEKVQVLSSTLRHAATEDCLKVLVEELRFPQPGKGTHAIVTHPFSFAESKG